MGRQLKKDFTQQTQPSIYSSIETSTEQVDKPRRRYTEAEADQFLSEGKTQGRKGLKAQRINLALYPEIYDYIYTIARAQGHTATELINGILRQHMDAHQDIYNDAKSFIERMDREPLI